MKMEYMSCPEAAKKWGISERRVQKLCEGERIPGVSKFVSMWAYPWRCEYGWCLADPKGRGKAD